MVRRAFSLRRTVTPPTDLIANPDGRALGLRAGSRAEAMWELPARLRSVGGAVADARRCLADRPKRAGIAPVGLAADIALPHARRVAVGRATQAEAFGREHAGVRLVFHIGTSKAAVGAQLRPVAGVSRRLKQPGVRRGRGGAKMGAGWLARLGRGGESKR